MGNLNNLVSYPGEKELVIVAVIVGIELVISAFCVIWAALL